MYHFSTNELPAQNTLPVMDLTVMPATAQVYSLDSFLQRVITIVENNLSDESFDVRKLAEEIGLCRRQLHRRLRKSLNQSPRRFITTFRLRRAISLMQRSNTTIAEIAYQCGFNTPNYFCKVFRDEFGCTPSSYREKNFNYTSSFALIPANNHFKMAAGY